MAVPGSVVGVGKLITPGGQQGPKGDAGTAANVPLADITQNGLLRQNTGKTTDFVDGTNNCQALAPQIWSTRLRSFNAIGNPNFEVDQRNVGNVVAAPATGALIQDRWANQHVGTLVASFGQRPAAASEVLLPGTNFAISRAFHRLTMTTAQASLGASDNLTLYTQVEGSQFRELQYDVHSISLLVRTSVAGLNFGLSVRDPVTTTKSLVKLCTIPAANTWTIVALPNLPIFPSGNFSTAPGVLGYLLGICLSAGATLIAPANDTWQNGNFIGAVGQSNFAAGSASTFDIAFIQHEPGSLCTTLIDKPFSQNLDECLRYYQKSYEYGSVPGAVTVPGLNGMSVLSGTSQALGPLRFHKPMAKIPTINIFSHTSGAAGTVVDNNGTLHTGAAAVNQGSAGFDSVTFTTVLTVPGYVQFHHTADTGW